MISIGPLVVLGIALLVIVALVLIIVVVIVRASSDRSRRRPGSGADGAARWLDRLSPHSLAYSLYVPSSPGETHLMGVFRGERARCAGGKVQGV